MPLPNDPSAPKDFDFIIGDWRVRHRRLKTRLAQCDEWVEFDGLSFTTKTLGGFGNVEDNLLHLPEGSYRAAAVRSFNAASGTWSIWWLDGRNPGQLDTPVVGTFKDHKGLFYAEDSFEGRPIKVRFTWLATPGQAPRWEQAFSSDAGASWETNWTMVFTPSDPHSRQGRDMPESRLQGGCQCGAVRYQVTGAPIMTAICHCSMCRRANAAPAVAWAMYTQEQVQFEGQPKLYASSEDARRGFCAHCGTQISFTADYIPGLIDLTIGSMDEPDALPPQFHYWHSRHLAWVEFADGLPRHPEFPPQG